MDHTRHIGIFNAKDWPVTLIGAGGIGSLTAIVLAKMGVPILNIYDPQVIDDVNIATQFYGVNNVSMYKVVALKYLIGRFSDETVVNDIIDRVGPEYIYDPVEFRAPIIISAVDSIKARQDIWAVVAQERWHWYLDARMSAEVFQLYAVNRARFTAYGDMIMGLKEEDVLNEPCTSKATIYTAAIAAGHIGATVRKIITSNEVPFFMSHDIINNNILVP